MKIKVRVTLVAEEEVEIEVEHEEGADPCDLTKEEQERAISKASRCADWSVDDVEEA